MEERGETAVVQENLLYYGDNLDVLRRHVPDESVDLVYLDPPFNSAQDYNVLFKERNGTESAAQIRAFEDTWRWDQVAARAYQEIVEGGGKVAQAMIAFHSYLGANDMLAYLAMMAPRLAELRRVLKETGTIYLHCDPTASHYLKILMDAVFGPANFLNDITWERFNFHADAHRWGRLHDIVLCFAKSAGKHLYTTQRKGYDEKYIKSHFKKDKDGRLYRLDNALAAGQGPARVFFGKTLKPKAGTHWRWSQENIDKLIAQGRIVLTGKGMPSIIRYLDEMPGHPIGDVWTDIPEINSQAHERLGYPTQKPLVLLERIIQASSNPGDLVLDPFCGCGTAIAAAQELSRRWIGIDITHLAISLQKYRMEAMFPDISFRVVGEPEDIGAAYQLAHDSRYQFQWWALSLVRAKPLGGQEGSKAGKKGSDKGVDGIITFIDDAYAKPKRVLVQVKSGHVNAGDIRDLIGTVEQEKAVMGVLITLEPPTGPMESAAVTAGYYHSPGWNQDYRRIQILTIEHLLKGAEVKMPPTAQTFKQAPKVGPDKEEQSTLGL